MKKSLLLLIPSVFMVVSCGKVSNENPDDDPNIPCQHIDENPKNHYCDLCGVKLTNHTDLNEDKYCDFCGEYIGNSGEVEECEDEDMCEAEKVASTTESSTKYPFYLKVGEKKTVSCTAKGTTIEEQKHFTWENLNTENLDLVVNPSNDNKVEITGVKDSNGSFAQFKATNVYTPTVTRTFNTKVIDFTEDDGYLWQCGDKVDRTPFGYDSKTAKAGIQSGTATLGKWNWEFERSAINALNSYNGAIGFGKGENPENLTLTTTNSRKIKSITVEHSSANSLATLNVYVGETNVGHVNSLKARDSILNFTTFDCKDAAGDIKLEFTTPAYDFEAAQSESYYAPGATYLKSILVLYGEETVSEIRISDKSTHQTVFTSNGEVSIEGLIVEKVTDSGVYEIANDALKITKPVLSDEVENGTVEIEYEASGTTFVTSYDVYKASSLEIDDTTSPTYIDYVEYGNFDPTGLVVNACNKDKTVKFNITDELTWCQTSKFKSSDYTAQNQYLDEGATEITGFLKNATSLNTVSLTINPVYKVTSMGFDESSKAKTTTYLEGTNFSYSGVVVLGYCENENAQPSKISNKLGFYDGQSYENNPTDSSKWTKELIAGSTCVYGVLPDHECEPIKVEGLTVFPVDHIKAEGTLKNTEFGVGDKFNPNGLTFYAYGEDESLGSVKVDAKNFVWYDGVSYDADESTKTETLAAGTTYVVGVYKDTDVTLKIEGITVVEVSYELNAATSIAAGDQILVTSADDGVYINLNETSTNKYTSEIVGDLSKDTISITNSAKAALLTVEVVDAATNQFALKLEGTSKYVAIGSTGLATKKSDLNNHVLTFTFDDDGNVKISGTYTKTDGVTKTEKNIIVKNKQFTVSTDTECSLKLFKLPTQN